jgi:hypothetical protein
MTPVTIIGFGVSSTAVPFAAIALVAGATLAGLLLATVTVLVVADLRSAS